MPHDDDVVLTVERVIPASADPGRNTSLHDVRTFSGVRHPNAACTFSYINVPPRFSLLRAARSYHTVCLSYARVGAMFCVTMPTWPCEEYVLSTSAHDVTRGSHDYALYAF